MNQNPPRYSSGAEHYLQALRPQPPVSRTGNPAVAYYLGQEEEERGAPGYGRYLEQAFEGPNPEQQQWLDQHATPVQQLGYADSDSFLRRAGSFTWRMGKEIGRSMYFVEPGIGGKERAVRAATLGSMFIPFGGTIALTGRAGAKVLPAATKAALATRKGQIGLTAAQEALIGAGLAKMHGESTLLGAGLGATLGGGVQSFILRGQRGVNRARTAAARAGFANADTFTDLARTPLVDGGDYAILTSQRSINPSELNAELFEKLHKDLVSRGFEPIPMRGFEPIDRAAMEGIPADEVLRNRFYEDALLVPGMDERTAIELGQKYSQDAVISSRGLIDLNKGTLRLLDRGKTRFNVNVSPYDDYFSEITVGGKKQLFALGFADEVEQLGETALRRVGGAPEQAVAAAVRTGPGPDDFVIGFSHGQAAEEAAKRFAEGDIFTTSLLSPNELAQLDKMSGTLQDLVQKLSGKPRSLMRYSLHKLEEYLGSRPSKTRDELWQALRKDMQVSGGLDDLPKRNLTSKEIEEISRAFYNDSQILPEIKQAARHLLPDEFYDVREVAGMGLGKGDLDDILRSLGQAPESGFTPGWVTDKGRFVSEVEWRRMRQGELEATRTAIDAARKEPSRIEKWLTSLRGWDMSARLGAWYRATVDRGWGAYEAQRALGKKPWDLKPSESWYKLVALARGYAGRAEVNLMHSLTTVDGSKVLRPGLFKVLSAVKPDDFDEFIRYGFARRWLAIAKQKSYELPMKTDGSGRFTVEELQALVQSAPEYFSRGGSTGRGVFGDIVDWRNTLLKEYLGNSGILTRKSVKAILSSEDYVPLRRDLDQLVSRTPLDRPADLFAMHDPVKKIRALGDQYVDWLEVLQKETVLFSKLASDQRVVNRIVKDLGNLHPEFMAQFARRVRKPKMELAKARREAIEQIKQSDPELASMVQTLDNEILALLAPGKFGRAYVGALNRGKRAWYEITDEGLWDAIRSLSPVEMGLFSKIIGSRAVSAPGRWLRVGATHSFEFMARNPIRDVMFALVTAGTDVGMARAPFEAVRRFSSGIASAFNADEWFQRWGSGGGFRAALVSMDRNVLRDNFIKSTGLGHQIQSPADLAKHPLYTLGRMVKHPIDALRAVSELGESGTRLGHFKAQYNKLLGEGWKANDALEEAAFRSRNISVDFSTHGLKTAALARAAAFWNPMIQGYRQAAQSFYRDPNAWQRGVAYITVPSVMLYMVNRRDPDYFNLPDWERAIFWHVRAGEHWIRIPKPFELGILFGSLPERMLQAMDQDQPEALDGAFAEMLKDLATDFIPTPTSVEPFIERAVNRSFFTGRPIVPRGQEDVDPLYRATPGTSEFAKGLVRMLQLNKAGLDAPTIDHIFRSYTGGLGRMATDWVDILTANADLTEHEFPVVKGFLSRFPENNQASEEFYRFADDVRQASTTYAKLERELRLDELQDYYQQNMQLFAAQPWVTQMLSQLAELRHMRDMIGQDKALPFKSRREMIDDIVDFEYELVQLAGEMMEFSQQLR